MAFFDAFLVVLGAFDGAARGEALVAQHTHHLDLRALTAPAAELQHFHLARRGTAVIVHAFGFLFGWAPQHQQFADVLNRGSAEFVRQGLEHGFARSTVIGEDPHLDEAMGFERQVGFTGHGRREPIVANENHGGQVVRIGTVRFALGGGELYLRHGTIIGHHLRPWHRGGKHRQGMKVNTKSKKVNKAWLNDHVNDTYVKLAKKEGFRARAAYKLKEIDETFGLIKPGDVVVDVRRKLSPQGAAAGALNGTIIAMDLLPMEAIEGVVFIEGDFREDSTLKALQDALAEQTASQAVDVVVSDMAPNLSGIGTVDAARIAHLIELAVDFSMTHLKPGGALVVKLFHGGGYSDLVQLFKAHFRVVKPFKPKASRDKSSETFLVGMGPLRPTET